MHDDEALIEMCTFLHHLLLSLSLFFKALFPFLFGFERKYNRRVRESLNLQHQDLVLVAILQMRLNKVVCFAALCNIAEFRVAVGTVFTFRIRTSTIESQLTFTTI